MRKLAVAVLSMIAGAGLAWFFTDPAGAKIRKMILAQIERL